MRFKNLRMVIRMKSTMARKPSPPNRERWHCRSRWSCKLFVLSGGRKVSYSLMILKSSSKIRQNNCCGKAWDLSRRTTFACLNFFRTEYLAWGPDKWSIFDAESYYLESFTSKIPLSSLRNISKNEEDDFDQRERERDGLSEFSEICSLIHTEWNLIQAPDSLPAWKQTKRLKK